MSKCDYPDFSMLILQTLKTADENHEVKCLVSKCSLLGITPQTVQISSEEELDEILSKRKKYDFIYLSAHGGTEGFSNDDDTLFLSWEDLATKLCQGKNMTKKCIVMLSCCRGGLNEVAYTLFHLCDDIQYVCGPRQDLSSCELSIAFHIFLFNYFERNLDPIEAAKKVKKGTGIRLVCFDRLETRTTEGYSKYVEENFENNDEFSTIDEIKEIVRLAIQEYNYGKQNQLPRPIEFSFEELINPDDSDGGRACCPGE